MSVSGFVFSTLILEDMSSEKLYSEVYVVEHKMNKQQYVRICLGLVEATVREGPLKSFREILLGEHITPTLELNIIKCESGYYIGLENATIQLSICQRKWGLFTRFYALLTMNYVDWTEIYSHAAALRQW